MYSLVRRGAALAASSSATVSSRGSFLAAAQTSKTFNMASRKQSTLPAGYKEDNSKGAMLRFEDSLPKLPVPTLAETSQRYLRSVHCLLSEEEYARTKKAVQDFIAPGAIGEKLQKRLEDRAAEPGRNSWLNDWWTEFAYLTYRDPVVPYVSYFYSHRDDKKRRDPAKRAAAITTAVLEFKKQVDEGTLEPEYMKGRPIAMSSYQYMFNCTRRPGKTADYPVKYDYKENQYLIAIRRNQFFKIPHAINGKQLNTAELEEQFKRVYASAEKSPAIGSLTTGNRDVWFANRERLVGVSPLNADSIKTIEAASFIVALDDANPVTREERAHAYWHGDGANRWFDSPLQFIINDNGTSGFCGEHSMMDGTPTHRLNDYACGLIAQNALDFDNPSVRSDLPPPEPLRWELNGEVLADISLAQTAFTKVISQHELRVEAYQGYGKGLMKRFRCSPDAYTQMIIQLAYHKMYSIVRPVYESAATRRFQEGRTETCRSVSDESVAFCNAMAHPLTTQEECRDLFRKALASQGSYIVDASDGRGVDRHLFGLKKLLKEGEELPEIYKDPAYSYSCSWYVSSSQLSSEYYNGYGWSQVLDGGYGIAYMIQENSIQFNVVCKGGLHAERMQFYLNEAAGDIRDIMMPTLEQKAKL